MSVGVGNAKVGEDTAGAGFESGVEYGLGPGLIEGVFGSPPDEPQRAARVEFL